MINCTCVIQEGQSPDLRRGEMQSVLKSFASRSFGQEAQIAWVPVAEGNGFTAGEPSTSSIVSFTAHEQLSPERRETLLRELVSLWTERTGCTVDEIVAVIADPATH
jgi:hypothetical protein